MCQKGSAVERRQTRRRPIEVDIEIAHAGAERCYGVAENISRNGVSVHLSRGELPAGQRSVILNFKIWTGKETLYRKIYARVVRTHSHVIGCEFAEHDFVAEAIVQDLMYYQRRNRQDRRVAAIGPDTDGGLDMGATVEQTI